MSSVLLVKTAVRGYHVYQVVWEPRRGDLFVSLHESENGHDRYAMAIYRSDVPGVVVEHLPKKISKCATTSRFHLRRPRSARGAECAIIRN